MFVGKLIPLHGLQLILDAAALVPEIPFTVVGTGQEQHILGSAPPNVRHVPWINYADLPAAYASAGCALGIFGSGPKTDRVIPNKVFQALATGTPVITADTAGVRELLTDQQDALLVERSPEALAAAVCSLAENGRSPPRSDGPAGRPTSAKRARKPWVSAGSSCFSLFRVLAEGVGELRRTVARRRHPPGKYLGPWSGRQRHSAARLHFRV